MNPVLGCFPQQLSYDDWRREGVQGAPAVPTVFEAVLSQGVVLRFPGEVPRRLGVRATGKKICRRSQLEMMQRLVIQAPRQNPIGVSPTLAAEVIRFLDVVGQARPMFVVHH